MSEFLKEHLVGEERRVVQRWGETHRALERGKRQIRGEGLRKF